MNVCCSSLQRDACVSQCVAARRLCIAVSCSEMSVCCSESQRDESVLQCVAARWVCVAVCCNKISVLQRICVHKVFWAQLPNKTKNSARFPNIPNTCTHKKKLLKRPTKEAYKSDPQKDRTNEAYSISARVANIPLHTQKRPTCTLKRDHNVHSQKRPANKLSK